jgi:hypothetical protein
MDNLEIDKKKSFKIILNSRNGASRTGSIASYVYTVDFRQVVRTDIDYSKQYKVWCSFISTIGTTANVGVDPTTNNYGLHIDFGKGQNIIQFNTIRPISFILPVVCVPLGTTVGTSLFGFELKENDNQPFIINDIRNITNLHITIVENNGATFSTAQAQFNYICSLTFEEC